MGGYRRYKDRTRLIASRALPFGIRTPPARKGRFYVEAYLWPDFDAIARAGGYPEGEKAPGALFLPMPWTEELGTGARRLQPKLGEIHLATGWCHPATLAHEAYHATEHFRRLWLVSPDPPGSPEYGSRRLIEIGLASHYAIAGEHFAHGDAEEECAYATGALVESLYGWLEEIGEYRSDRLAGARPAAPL